MARTLPPEEGSFPQAWERSLSPSGAAGSEPLLEAVLRENRQLRRYGHVNHENFPASTMKGFLDNKAKFEQQKRNELQGLLAEAQKSVWVTSGIFYRQVTTGIWIGATDAFQQRAAQREQLAQEVAFLEAAACEGTEQGSLLAGLLPRTLQTTGSRARPLAPTGKTARSMEAKTRATGVQEMHAHLQSFLRAHQFSDVNEPRVKCSCLPFCNREVLYPIHLAAQLGDALALEGILEAGGDLKRRSGVKKQGEAPGRKCWTSNGDGPLEVAMRADVNNSHRAVLSLLSTRVQLAEF
eukprot:g4438.t1